MAMRSNSPQRTASRAPLVHKHVSFSQPRCRRPVGIRLNKRARGHEQNQRLPFVPPEDWHEPHERGGRYRIVVQDAGPGYRHVVTPAEVRERLAQLPSEFVKPLEVVQFSRMTRKKRSFPCYGMQWGATLYLYPLEDNLIEYYARPPKPAQLIEARMYGGRWVQEGRDTWKLVWTPESIRDYYLNNILIHELGHLLDDRNNSYNDRERFAEWFAVEYGYRNTSEVRRPRPVERRHHTQRSA